MLSFALIPNPGLANCIAPPTSLHALCLDSKSGAGKLFDSNSFDKSRFALIPNPGLAN